MWIHTPKRWNEYVWGGGLKTVIGDEMVGKVETKGSVKMGTSVA